MSVNCIWCVRRKRTGTDLLCDECRREKSSAQPANVLQGEGARGEIEKLFQEIYESFECDDCRHGQMCGHCFAWRCKVDDLRMKVRVALSQSAAEKEEK